MEWSCEVNQLAKTVSTPNMARLEPVLPSISMDKARTSTIARCLPTLSTTHHIYFHEAVMEVRELVKLQVVLMYRTTSNKFLYKTT